MKPTNLLLALGLSLGGSFLAVLSAKATIQLPESCRMGSCYQSTLESKEALRSNEFGTLYLVNVTTNGRPQTFEEELAAQDRRRFIDFHGSDRTVDRNQQYVFCSPSIPSTLFESEGEYVLNRLALFESPSNAVRFSHQLYLATCHNLAGPDYFSAAVQTRLIREGYTTGDMTFTEQNRVSNILEMMELYPDTY